MAASTHLLPRAKSPSDAEFEFHKLVAGDPRLLCKYLAVICCVLGILAIGLLALNFHTATQQRERIVIRVDDVGRAQAIGFSHIYKVEPAEVKYFLADFVTHYYGRNRQTLRSDIERSMYFLDTQLATARMGAERTNKVIEKFLVSSDDQVDIKVNNIVVGDLSQEPYTVKVDLDKIYVSRSGSETKREKFVDEITFTRNKDVPNAYLLVNPLGLVILALRENQAF